MKRRDRAAEAAAILRECRAALIARGSTVIREATGAGPADIVDWRHYPAGEVYDPATHIQYFYHRHPDPPGAGCGSPAECGHFHLFLRGEGIPAGLAPLLLAENAVAGVPLPTQSPPLKRGSRDEVCHLVAIAVDVRGEPIRLFTTNRWVTGETWYRAEDVIRMLERVCFVRSGSPALLDRWLEALVRLLQPDIAELLRRRDEAIMQWRWRWPRSNVFEDPRLEIASSCDIDLETRLAAIEASATFPVSMPAAWRRPALPSMAEGWGT